MEKLKKADVIIDVCNKCKGMWLDAGEIDKLAAMSRSIKESKEKKSTKKKGGKNGKKK
jgi:Zn-finger nucleic acid-binding protein